MTPLVPLRFDPGRVNGSQLVRLPDGRQLQLYFVVGGAPRLRSVLVWRWRGRPLGASVAAAA